MKIFSCRLALRIVCLLASAIVCAGPAAAAERGPLRQILTTGVDTAAEARVIVKYRADSTLMRAQSASAALAPPQHAQSLATRLGLALRDGRPIGSRAQVVKGTGISSRDLADRLAAQSDVEYAVVDGRVRALAIPNDPLYGTQTATTPLAGQWYLRAPTGSTIVDSTSLVSSINAPAAWAVTTGSASVVVAMLDTGVRFDHPDLTSKLLPGYDFISNAATAGDGDGRDADASDPGDYVLQSDVGVIPGCTSSDVGDSSWHGTETAGLVGAATNNGIGMASIGYNVMLLPVRVLGKCGGYDSDIQAAMLWAAGLSSVPVANPNPAKVINMSLGSQASCSSAYQDVVNQVNAAGVVVVAAAGNQGLAVGSPANCSGVIAVAGVRQVGTKVGYSDLGPEIAIAAPAGNCVNTGNNDPCLYPLLTTSNTGTTTPVSNANGGSTYTTSGSNASLGTSFSAPLVSGTVALMFSANGSLTPAQVLTALKASARPFPSSGSGTGVTACVAPSSTAQSSECYCTTSTCGAGLLDAGAAVALVSAATANISVGSSVDAVGTPVTLDGSGSSAGGNTITGYQWAITSGADTASFTSATNASTATVLASAAGTVVVSLTITDSAGRQATSSTTLNFAALTTNPTPTTPTGSSGGGGGALGLGGLLGWLAAVVAVWAVRRPRASRRP